jgi:hypothetical protein
MLNAEVNDEAGNDEDDEEVGKGEGCNSGNPQANKKMTDRSVMGIGAMR